MSLPSAPSPLVHAPPLSISAPLMDGHLLQAFDIAVAAHGLSHIRRAYLGIRAGDVEQLARHAGIGLEASVVAPGQSVLVGHAGTRELVEIVSQHGSGHVRVAADDAEVADALLEQISARVLADAPPPEDPRVAFCFWTLTDHGPQPMWRRLHAPTWAEIADNYVGPVRDALATIMASPPDTARGIALWRGAPGTGKTTALRALAREWQEHVEVHVIVDPEVFLGARASYLVNVLFGHDVDEAWDGTVGMPYDMGASIGMHGGRYVSHAVAAVDTPRRRAKLVVLEDAGELISADARVSSGQALSRLLNLTDGLLGQGANLSMLVTTNEPIDRLHPAVARPGRGWAHIEFATLGVDEANAWLRSHDQDATVDAPTTLASLYSIVRGDQIVALDSLEH